MVLGDDKDYYTLVNGVLRWLSMCLTSMGTETHYFDDDEDDYYMFINVYTG